LVLGGEGTGCCDSGQVWRYMSEERAHRMNDWIDGWMNDLSSKRQGHDISKELGLRR
jgi:hypothetical protein